MIKEEAAAVSEEIVRRAMFGGASVKIIPVGSVRRGAAQSSDLDFLVLASTAAGADVLSKFTLRPARAGDRITVKPIPNIAGSRHRQVVLSVVTPGFGTDKIKADLFLADPADKPFALFHYTGSRDYNIRTRAHAKHRGWKLNQYGLYSIATGHRVRGSVAIRTERDLARFLKVSYRPPEDRD